MNILVTGGLGLLGTNLCYEFLKENKRKVIAYDLSYRIPKFLSEFEDDENFVFVKGDVEDIWNLLEIVKKYDVIDMIHTASLLEDKASIQRPYQFIRTNILGGLNVLEIARIFKLRRLIVISSRAAYGSYPPHEGPLGEGSLLRPIGFYGASKASIDLIVPLYRIHYKVDTLSIRTTGVFGPGQGEAGMGFTGTTSPIYNILSCVLKGKPFSLSRGGDHYLEFCYVKDLARAVKLILEADSVRYPIYNVSSGKQFTLSEVGSIIKKLLPESQIHIGPGTLEGTELRAVLDVHRVREEFGFEPSPITESIENFIEYLTV